MESNRNFTVVGIEADGTLICRPGGTSGDEDYNCGETLEEFGVDRLFENERTAIGADALTEATGRKFITVDGVVFEDICEQCHKNLLACGCVEA